MKFYLLREAAPYLTLPTLRCQCVFFILQNIIYLMSFLGSRTGVSQDKKPAGVKWLFLGKSKILFVSVTISPSI